MTDLERLREEIAEIIRDAACYLESLEWDDLDWEDKEPFFISADQILSLKVYKGKSGEVYTFKDLIERGVIPVEDPKYPDIPRKDIAHIIYERDRQLREANFIQVDPRGDQ